MISLRTCAGLGFLLFALGPAYPDTVPAIHYAPAQNLEHIDVALIDGARKEIDFAAYILTDWPVMQALSRAARRGVKVRIYVDSLRQGGSESSPPFRALLSDPLIGFRVKPAGTPLMHLKSYQIDHRLLRTGSANFSASGLKRQDNDLVVMESRAAAAAFVQRFEAIYAKGQAVHRF
jgi:phosphatidylserine/phosphatidylglycerophosphate/cardiolipin synthase-like enzyme